MIITLNTDMYILNGIQQSQNFEKKKPKTNYFAGVGCDWLCIFLPDRKYKTPRDAELHKATFVCLFNLIRIRGNDSSPDDMQQEGDIKQLLLLRGQ